MAPIITLDVTGGPKSVSSESGFGRETDSDGGKALRRATEGEPSLDEGGTR